MELAQVIEELEQKIEECSCTECYEFYAHVLEHLIDYRKLVG